MDRWEFGAGAVEWSTAQGDRPLGVFDVLKLVEFIPEVRAPHAVGRFHGLGCDWIVGRQWRMVRIVGVEEPAPGVGGDVKVVLGPARVVGFFLEDPVGLFVCRFPVMVSRAPDQHQNQPQPTQGHPSPTSGTRCAVDRRRASVRVTRGSGRACYHSVGDVNRQVVVVMTNRPVQ